MDISRFGFTPTEARVYAKLLSLAPATGYALAQAAGLARANTYDALEALVARGAATRLPGKPARYAALDPEALVGRLRRELSDGLDSLARELRSIRRAPPMAATAVEMLTDKASLLARVAECATAGRTELLAVVGPWAEEDVFDALEAALKRRSTRVLSLGMPGPGGAAVRDVAPRELEAYWGGLPVAIVADKRRAVCGIVDGVSGGAGIATEHPGLVPFLRHLLRRELASASPHSLS